MEKQVISKTYVEGELTKYQFPGMGVGVVKDGQVLFCGGFGYRDVEKKLPITEKTQWGIASCTKAFTATLAGMLADEKYFELEQPIKEYLPDFEMYDSATTAQCTIKDMLTHRTGLGGYDALWCDVGTTRADLWKRLRYLKPNKAFRSTVQYSNLMYAMAGHICERVTGKTWDQLIQERIFVPLEMCNSNTSINNMMQSDNYASPYWQSDCGPVLVDNWNVDLGGPAASINSTLQDMLKWLQFNIDGGVTTAGQRLIKADTLDEIHTAQVRYKMWPWDFPEIPPIGGYGMGWYNDVYRGNPLYFHIGEIEGYGTMQWVLPREKLGIVVFNNIHKPCVLIETSVVYTIIDQVLNLPPGDWSDRFYAQKENYGYMLEHWELDLMGDRQIKGTSLSHEPQSYAGVYENPGHGKLEVVYENNQFICVYRDVRQPMEHYHYDVFRVPHIKMDTLLVTSPLSFLTNAEDGTINRLEWKLYSQVEPIVFVRE